MFKDEDLKELSYSTYWDQRYKSEMTVEDGESSSTLQSYEWFRNYQILAPFFARHLPSPPSNTHILHLGCGNSSLTADLHASGYASQTSVDFSEIVIDAMREKYADIDTKWRVMDVRDLQLQDASVDFAIDKMTLDGFINGSVWDPPADVRTNVERYVQEVGRVLKPGGVWLYISYRQPHFIKMFLLKEELWTLSVETLKDISGAGGFEYFGYVMRRHSPKQ